MAASTLASDKLKAGELLGIKLELELRGDAPEIRDVGDARNLL
jgi:hypothetical protein